MATRNPEDATPLSPPADLSDLTPEQRALLVLRMRRKAAEKGVEGPPPIPRVPREGDLPLSFAQQRLWFLDRLDPGNPAYNIPSAIRLSGALDVAAFGRAVTELVRRHEVLRTTFPEAGGEPRQEIAPPPAALPLPRIDLSGLPAARRGAVARELALEAARRPFDLGRDMLVRVLLLRLETEVHVALFNLHHIVADGWSVAIVIREIAGAYAAFAAGRAPELPELPIQYVDFAVWQRGFLAGPELERQLAFWRQTLAGAPPVLELPMDRRRPPFQTFRGGRREVYLPPELWGEVRAASQRYGATSFMTALASFKALLARLTGQEDVVVGSPIANRNRAEIEGLIGLFANTLVLRTDLSAAPSLRQAVGRVREGTLAAYAHQDLPFEEVVKELGGRDLSRNPLFQVMFSLANVPRSGLAMEGLALAYENGYGDTAKFDFDMMTSEQDGVLAGEVEYNADLFDPTSVDRIVAHWRSLLTAAVAEPDRPLAELPLLSAAERQQLAEEWSHPEAVPRLAGTLHGLFAAQAARTPAATAVIAGTERLSYGELAGRVRDLAGRLSQLGLGPERIVGVRLGRTADLVVALLAVLESGAAYLPLDPAYPAERLGFLLADTGAALVVTERSLPWPEGFTAEIPTLYVDEATPGTAPAPAPCDAAEENLAYLIYTSGSTGVPKGVAIPHGSALRLIEWALARYSAAELAGVLFSTSTSFDLSIFELFVPLSSGGAVIVADNALALAELPAAPEVTLVNTVPSALAGLLDLGPLPASVRTVNLAGEPLRGALAERVHAAGVERLWNLYGPSEDTTYSTATEVVPAITGTGREPDIGRPVAGSTAFVLDGSLAMLPVGVPGELCLGGAALARGYLNRPALTAERFVPDPFAGPGARLYRTGDRARWRPDGTLELLGRLDQQVKVRGFRIELGEIEAVLAGHPAVREAAVTAPADASGDRRLVAYVAADGPLDVAALGVYLGSRLPSFMVPSAWVELAALPRTRTGKVDRQALPVPGETAAETAYEAPRTATEKVLAGIWGDLLGRERVGVYDNFFALGGHSLLAAQVVARLRDRLGVELPVRAFFEQPTVAGLAVLLASRYEGGEEGDQEPIVALPRDAEGGGTFPASFAQRRMWFLDQLEPGSPVYNMPLALLLEGELDEARLAAVFGELTRRHETLRTTFTEGDDGPLQVVHPAAARPFALESIDLSALGEEERRRELTRRVAAESLRPFDLAAGPLLRATLVRLAPRENALLLNLHHVISDGWSMGVLVQEVTALYAAAVEGRPLSAVLPPLPVQYADFSVWQSRRLAGEKLRREVEYWRQKLAGVPPFLELPTDRPRPPVQTFAGRRLPLWIEPGLAAGLAALALGTGTTLFMVLLAGFELLLGIYSGAEDLAVGTPIAGRNWAELEGLIGIFVNSLVLRGDLSGDPPFFDLLGRVREDTLSAYAHQDLPFEKLVEEFNPERSPAHSPIFQAMFALQNAPLGEESELPGLTLRTLEGRETPAKFDLALSMTERNGGIGGSLEYNVDLFDAPTMVRLLDHFRSLLEGVVADPGAWLSTLPRLGAAERQQLLREWSDASPIAGSTVPLHELFAAQAARRPDAMALVSGDRALTYGELARTSSRMARRLAELGVGPGVLVGLCAERSPELVLGVLAILAAGGAYLPLDPAHPAERLAYTLADAGAPVLLADESLHERLPAGAARMVGLHALAGEEDEDQFAAGAAPPPAVRIAPSTPGDLAYVIYTSGSTGRPKGVEVTHANAARLFTVIRQSFELGPDDVWTLFHSIAFDFSVWELWGALAFGGRLVIVPGDTARSPEVFYELLRRERVTVLSQTPSAFRQLIWAEGAALDRGEPMVADLRLVVFGGEALDPAALAPWIERHGDERPLLVNLYGITETTVHTTWRRLRQSDLARPGSAVGRPLSDLALYLLDSGGQPVPIGAPGEIHVGGAGVARGYLGRPALTAQRFVPDPFTAGDRVGGLRLYRSGDLARWRPDGDLEYLGRIDRQVKVRGFRIELGEIEAALAEHPGVREAAVVAREDRPGDLRLVGYVSSAAGPDSTPQALAAFLAERLPVYMVPAAWVLLDRLPLTANGKVDRAALPAPSGKVDRAAALPAAPSESGEGGAYVAPRSPVEQVLAGIWEEVLGLQRVGVQDDFFALGGHSLIAAQVTSRVLKALSVDLSLRVLFERPTVAAMAAEIESLRGSGAATGASAAPPLVRAPHGTEAPLSFRQEWRWLFDQVSLEADDAGGNVPLALTLSGAVSPAALAAALAAVVERHESLRTRFVSVGARPLQRIDPPWRPPLPFVDLAGLPPAAAEREATRLAAAEWTIPFDLVRGPLLRSALLRLAEESFVFLLTLNHIISDGWSMRILAREVTALYEAAQAGLPSPLPALPIQFRDFAIWQRGWLQGEALEHLLGAAVARLADVPSLDLPVDRRRAARLYSSSGRLPFRLDADLTASLRALSRGEGASLFMTVLAGFTGLLQRHTGRGEFPIATITAGRTRAEIEPLVGYFTNTLVIRAAAGGDPGFVELLARTRGATLAAYDHQDLPFSLLVDALRTARSGVPPVFEVLFILQPQMLEVAAEGVEVANFPVQANQGGQDFALVLDLVEAGGGLIGSLSYNQALVDSTTALRWRGHLETLLAGAAADPERPLTELPLLSEGERHQVTFEWGEVVLVDGGPAPIGIWGELAGEPAGRRVRRLADGTLEVSTPAGAGFTEPAAAPAPTAATASKEPGEPARSLDSLSAAKRKLLAKRIRGER